MFFFLILYFEKIISHSTGFNFGLKENRQYCGTRKVQKVGNKIVLTMVM